MRFLVPAASAALFVATAVSATAALPNAVPTPVSNAVPTAGAPPVLASAATAIPPATGTPRPTGNDTAVANTAQVAPSAGFAWPLFPRPMVLRPFEQPMNQWSAGHRGTDLLTAVGQPVLSAGEGIVAFSGVVAGRGVITVRHSGGLRTTYEPIDERMASGTVVQRGGRIGVVSPTAGHCAPQTCVHWGAISGQTYRDPLSLLGFGRPILLPLG